VGYKGGLEPKVAAMLRRKKVKAKHESKRIPYEIREKHYYLPDFVITDTDGHVWYLEVKGWFRPQDVKKMKWVKECNADLDIRFMFASDSKFSSKGKMRYSDWCKKHGYQYCVGELPNEWFK
jgi:hypothetical protein